MLSLTCMPVISARLIVALCLLLVRATVLSADDLPIFIEDLPLRISLGIRDSTYVAAAQRVGFPLAFRAENSGTITIPKERVAEIFAEGVIHVLPKNEAEQRTKVQKMWRTMIYDLKPGKTFESPNYGDLLAFFPSLPDGDYQVWWTLDKLKSNVLRFTVTNGKVQLQEPEA